MTIRHTKQTDIPALRQLWKQAFGDGDAFLDSFFSVAYAPERSLCAWEDGKIVAMVYWLDFRWREHKIAYGYAVATDEKYRKRGICHKLLESMRQRLRKQGYYGILLVPENRKLLEFYERMGYTPCCGMEHFDIPAAGRPDPGLRPITWEQYARYRLQLLPEESLHPGDEVYRFLDSYLKFYRADAGIFCCAVEETPEGRLLRIEEFLGEPKGLFAITAAMGCQTCKVRLRGHYAYGVFRHLTRDKALPKYHGLPMK